jgi:hypothetical protein
MLVCLPTDLSEEKRQSLEVIETECQHAHKMATSNGKVAQQTFELNNSVQVVPEGDKIYAYDNEEQRRIQQARPWKADPHHFKHVRISAVALVKMVTHARSGGQYEIMGLMQGKIEDETFVVMDAFALPVLGTETRVNAGAEGDEYSVQYQTISKDVSWALLRWKLQISTSNSFTWRSVEPLMPSFSLNAIHAQWQSAETQRPLHTIVLTSSPAISLSQSLSSTKLTSCAFP